MIPAWVELFMSLGYGAQFIHDACVFRTASISTYRKYAFTRHDGCEGSFA